MTALERLYHRFDTLAPDERERRAEQVLEQFDEIERVREALKPAAKQRLAGLGTPLEDIDLIADLRRRHVG